MFDKLISLSIWLFLFLLPLFFLPIGNTGADADKQLLLVVFALLLFFLLVIKKTLKEKAVRFTRTDFDLPLLLLALTYLISAVFIAPAKMNAFTYPLSLITIIAAVVLYFSLTHALSDNHLTMKPFNNETIILTPLLLSSTLVALVSIGTQFKLLPSLWPLGNNLTTAAFLLVVAVYIGADLVFSFSSKPIRQISLLRLIWPAFSLLAISVSLTVSSFHLLTDDKPLILPFSFGWAIMMEAYKNFQNFLFGVGPANFPVAFNLGKPLLINTTDFWNITPNVSSNLPLHMATEAGIAAGLLFLLIFFKSLKLLKSLSSPQSPIHLSLAATLFLQIILPPNISLLILTVILLAFTAPKWKTRQFTLNSAYPLYLIPFASLIILASLFWQGKIYLAEIFYRRAISAATSQQVANSFSFAKTAIDLNPYSDKYYTFGSYLDLAIARNLAQNKETASSSAKQINDLTQEAVAYARQAVNLNENYSQNWAQLADVYQSLIGSVDKAEQFTFDAFNREIMLNPVSPLPKMTAAGFLMSFRQYGLAENLFNQTISLKPDLNSAHYNLARLLILNKRYQEAEGELRKTLNLTPIDTEDYKKVQSDLDEVKKLLPPEATPSANSGQAPSAATPSAVPISPKSPK